MSGNNDTTRVHRAIPGDDHDQRLQRVEIAGEDAATRIRRLEKVQDQILKALGEGATAMALLQRDVRNILWVAGAIAVPVLGAIGTALVQAIRS